MFRIALKMVSKKLTNIKTSESKPSLLEEYLRSDETDFKDVIGMIVDTLLAGIDTVIIIIIRLSINELMIINVKIKLLNVFWRLFL